MTPTDLTQHFGSQAEAARALDVGRGTVWQWFRRGAIPEGRQYQIELLTDGALKAVRAAPAGADRAA